MKITLKTCAKHTLFDVAVQTLLQYNHNSRVHVEAEKETEKSNKYFSVNYLELKAIKSDENYPKNMRQAYAI